MEGERGRTECVRTDTIKVGTVAVCYHDELKWYLCCYEYRKYHVVYRAYRRAHSPSLALAVPTWH